MTVVRKLFVALTARVDLLTAGELLFSRWTRYTQRELFHSGSCFSQSVQAANVSSNSQPKNKIFGGVKSVAK